MKRIYIAGSYNGPDIITCLDNMRRGMQAAVKVLKAGYAPFCPFTDYHYRLMDGSVTREMYHAQSMAWLEASDAVLVLPNSENSKGTQAEIARATELGIAIYFNFHRLDAVENEDNQKAQLDEKLMEAKQNRKGCFMKDVFPVANWVLLRMVVENEFKGIILPETVQPTLAGNVIVAQGEKVTRCHVGDQVLLLPATAIKLDLPEIGPGFLLVQEEHIIAVLKEKAAEAELI